MDKHLAYIDTERYERLEAINAKLLAALEALMLAEEWSEDLARDYATEFNEAREAIKQATS